MKEQDKEKNKRAEITSSRRAFLEQWLPRGGAAFLAAAGSFPSLVSAQWFGFLKEEEVSLPTFFFAQLRYGSGMDWNPHPTAARSLMEILVKRTSIPASPERVDLTLDHPRLFYYPFLYWTGTREFEPIPQPHLDRLRRFLEYGGFLLVDDGLAAPGVGFDKSFQRELSRMFPGEKLERLPEEHTVFRSYYLLDRATGRSEVRPYLTGINRGDRTILIYSANDLGGAWARGREGKFLNRCEPGGEYQRERAIRLGINLVMYALCVNYKQDLIHVPFISKRRRGRP